MSLLEAALAASQCSTWILLKNPISNLKAALAASQDSNRISVHIPITNWKAALAALQCFHNGFGKTSNTDFEGCAGGLRWSIWILEKSNIKIVKAALAASQVFQQDFGSFNPPAYRPLDREACVESCTGIFQHLGPAIAAFGVVSIRIYSYLFLSVRIYLCLFVSIRIYSYLFVSILGAYLFL